MSDKLTALLIFSFLAFASSAYSIGLAVQHHNDQLLGRSIFWTCITAVPLLIGSIGLAVKVGIAASTDTKPA